MSKDGAYRESKEKRQHSSTLLPYSRYECKMPQYFVNVPMHWHSEFELDLVVSGVGEFVFNDEKYILSKGDVLILPPDMLHAVYPVENQDLFYEAVVFNKMMLGTESNDRSATECIQPIVNGKDKLCVLIPREHPNHEKFEKCAEEIVECAKRNSPTEDLLLKSLLLRFFWMLENSEGLIRKVPAEISFGDIVRPTLEYMNDHYASNITVEFLASFVHLSQSYYMSCFKKAVGIGAIEYLMQIRMKKAMELLSTTKVSVSEVAGRVGYNNLSNFNRQFKRIVGVTPVEYRKNNI